MDYIQRDILHQPSFSKNAGVIITIYIDPSGIWSTVRWGNAEFTDWKADALTNQATTAGQTIIILGDKFSRKGQKNFELQSFFHVYTTLVFTTYFSHFYVSDLGVIAVERDENKCQLNVKGNQGKNKGKK